MESRLDVDRPTRTIAFVLGGGAPLLDVAGPIEVFQCATRVLWELGVECHPAYRIEVIARSPGLTPTSCGIGIETTACFEEAGRTSLDTLVAVAGDSEVSSVEARFLHDAAPRSRRLVGIGLGTRMLAEAGLLSRRRASVSARWELDFIRRFGDVHFVKDRVFIVDGNVYTTMGACASLDLALALVQADFGREVAMAVARSSAMFLRRFADEAQDSPHLMAQTARSSRVRQLTSWIIDNPTREHSVELLAHHAAVSTRTLARLFHRDTGLSPAKFVERVRIHAAIRLMDACDANVESIASRSGFGTEERMRRAFHRAFGLSPREYAARLTTSPSGGNAGHIRRFDNSSAHARPPASSAAGTS